MANRNIRRNVRQNTKVEEVKYPVEDFMADKKASESEVNNETVKEPEETKKPEVPADDIDVKTAVIKNGKKLNLRTNKTKNASVLAVLGPDTKLTVLNYDPEAEWTQVTAVNDDVFGDLAFVMTEFIEVK